MTKFSPGAHFGLSTDVLPRCAAMSTRFPVVVLLWLHAVEQHFTVL